MLIIEGISSSYDQVRVLSRVSLNVKEGEVLGLLGRNGAGKSTLLKSIMGLVKIDEGTIKLDDVVLNKSMHMKYRNVELDTFHKGDVCFLN